MATQPNLFYTAIQGLLKSWTGLQLAVSNGFGGSESAEKAQWMVGVIEQFFNENDELESWEVENFINELLNQEFNLILEDSSTEQIAKELCEMYEQWDTKQLVILRNKIQKLPQANIQDCEELNNEPKHDDSEVTNQISNVNLSEEDTLNKTSKNQPDEDGWITVTKSKK